MTYDLPGKITLAEAVARVHVQPVPYALLFERGDLFRTWVIYVRGHVEP